MAVRTETKCIYTCDRCDDTWDSTMEWCMTLNCELYVMAIGATPKDPRHLCAECTKELIIWIETPPQMKPSEMGEL